MQELITGTGNVMLYFIIAASSAAAARFLLPIPHEVFRKILHCILLGSLLCFLYSFETWWISALTAIGFALVVYPILMLLERIERFSEFITERKKGELKSSLLLVFGMFAFIITICWGLLGDPYLVLASVYAWGFGDAAAALIGKRFGKHKIRWKYTDGKKSAEGSTAMYVLSFVTVCIILMCRGGMDLAEYILISAIVALVSMLAELYSKNGMDTIICPVCAMFALLFMLYVTGGLV